MGAPLNYSISLSFSLNFWSGREELLIRETDFGVFRFYDRQEQKEIQESPRRHYAQDKLSYHSLRGHSAMLESKSRKIRSTGSSKSLLRHSLRELEMLLSDRTVVYSSWRNALLYQIILSNGLLVNILLNKLGDIEKIGFDKYLVGRLPPDIALCDVVFSSDKMILTFLEPRVAVINFGKSIDFNCTPFETTLDKQEPKLQWTDLASPPGRRLKKKLVLSDDKEFFVLYWSASDHDVFPWTPNLGEEYRANVILFSIKSELKRLGYLRTHGDPISLRFVPLDQSPAECHPQICLLHYLGQETTRRGEINLENTFLYPVQGDLHLKRKSNRKLSLNSLVTCCEILGKLVILGCTDGNIMVYDAFHHKLDCQTKAPFIPYILRAHHDKAMFMTASEKGIVQCFDLALNPIRLQFCHDDQLGSNFLDLSQYFKAQMSLVQAEFCPRSFGLANVEKCAMTTMANNYLIFRFHGGPLVLAQIHGGIYSSGSLGPIQLTSQYLKNHQFHPILRLLNQLDWSEQGQTILTCLSMTFNKLLKCTFSRENEMLMELCLGLFHAPTKPISDAIMDEYAEPIHDLSRRFFHHLIRHQQLVKAFQLAVDINDYDLFMDIYHAASRIGDIKDLADAAYIKAQSVFHNIEEDEEAPSSDPNEEDKDSSEESLPPPPPTPPAPPHHPQPHLQHKRTTKPSSQAPLPSPMQLFSSAITTVQVEHHTSEQSRAAGTTAILQPPLEPHYGPVYVKSTSAKNIPTTEFKGMSVKENHVPNTIDSIPLGVRTSTDNGTFGSRSQNNVGSEEAEDIEVVHFGLV